MSLWVNLFIQHQIKIFDFGFSKSLQGAEKERQKAAVPFSILIGTIAFLYQYLYSFTFLTKVSIPLDTKTPAVFANFFQWYLLIGIKP